MADELNTARKLGEIIFPGNWKWAPGYEGAYAVSDAGHVVSFQKGEARLMKPARDSRRYGRGWGGFVEGNDWLLPETKSFFRHAPTDITLLLRIVEIYQKALERTEARIAAMALTTFPINVRELDGSISQHRPKSNAGEAYDDIRQALALADEIAGKP